MSYHIFHLSYLICLKHYGCPKTELNQLSEDNQMILWRTFNDNKKKIKIGETIVNNHIIITRTKKMSYEILWNNEINPT